jgi:hypothetical protein
MEFVIRGNPSNGILGQVMDSAWGTRVFTGKHEIQHWNSNVLIFDERSDFKCARSYFPMKRRTQRRFMSGFGRS